MRSRSLHLPIRRWYDARVDSFGDERDKQGVLGAHVPASVKKAPTQRRSRELVASLLEATRRILQSEGEAALNTNRIAEVAGVSVGSLYQYFADKDALVDALFEAETERNMHERLGWAREALAMSLEPMLRFFLERIVAQHRRMMSLHAALYREQQLRSGARQLGDSLVSRSPGEAHVVEAFLREWCTRHRDEVRPENLDHAAFLMDRLGYAMMRITLEERPGYLLDDRYVEEMIQLLVRYLARDDRPAQGATGTRST